MISCITAKPADKESLVLVIPEKSWYNLNYEKRSQRIRGYPMSNGSVSVSRVARVLNLKNFTDEIDLKKCKIISSDVNRPALQLTGYFEHFEESRIQLIGNVEYTFIQQMLRRITYRLAARSAQYVAAAPSVLHLHSYPMPRTMPTAAAYTPLDLYLSSGLMSMSI